MVAACLWKLGGLCLMGTPNEFPAEVVCFSLALLCLVGYLALPNDSDND